MEDTPTPDLPRSNRKAALIGGVVGSIGLAASLFALTASAGATGPTLQASDTEADPVAVLDDSFPDDEAWAEYDACVEAVFEAEGIDIEAAIADVDILDMDDFEGDFEFDPAVSIMDGEDLSFAEFGEGNGSVTITRTGDDLSVISAGDVVVEEIDWDDLEAEGIAVPDGDLEMFDDVDFEELDDEALEAFEEIEDALSTCDDQLPDGFDFEEFDDATEELNGPIEPS